MKRSHIDLTTKLASALLALGDIPYCHAKRMSDQQIISLYQFHHNIRHADGGNDEFWNLEPQLIVKHRAHTATVDVPQMAKSRRIRAKRASHVAVMDAKAGIDTPSPPPKRKHSWPKGRRLQSRGFTSGSRKREVKQAQ